MEYLIIVYLQTKKARQDEKGKCHHLGALYHNLIALVVAVLHCHPHRRKRNGDHQTRRLRKEGQRKQKIIRAT